MLGHELVPYDLLLAAHTERKLDFGFFKAEHVKVCDLDAERIWQVELGKSSKWHGHSSALTFGVGRLRIFVNRELREGGEQVMPVYNLVYKALGEDRDSLLEFPNAQILIAVDKNTTVQNLREQIAEATNVLCWQLEDARFINAARGLA